MNQNEQPRKAAGSSDRRNRRNTSSASQPQWLNERPHTPLSEEPQAYPNVTNYDDEEDNYAAPSHRPHTLSTDRDHMFHHSSSDIGDEWDLLDQDTRQTATPPSYTFPGTWPAALHDTSLALSSVSTATASYATALTHSGVVKAGWSIGSALASSANKSALSIAAWAVDRTGTGTDQLPGLIGGWVSNGKERTEEIRRAEQRRRARRDGGRGIMGELQTFGDERGAFVLETGEMSSMGEILGETRPVHGEDGFVEADTRGVSADERGVVEGPGGDEEVEEEEEEEADGLLRVFELDD
jgi:hypothetical protein